MFNYGKLEEAIASSGKKKTYLCQRLNRPPYYLRDVIKQKNAIPEEYQKILAEELGVTVNYLNDLPEEKDKYEIDKIKELAKEQGKSLSYICKQLNVANNYLTDVAAGRNQLKPDRLAQIADILGTTPEYLRGETDIKEKPAENGGLSEDDKKLLDFFNRLPEKVQNLFADMEQLSPEQLDALEAVVRSYLPKE